MVLSIKIAIILGNVDVNFPARFEMDIREFLGLVVTLRTPGDIVSVAKGVNVEDVDIGRREEGVLDEAGEHVPWVEKEKGSDEPNDICRAQRDNQSQKLLVLEEISEMKPVIIVNFFFDGYDGNIDKGEDEVYHDANPEVDYPHVEFVRALRTITEGQDKGSKQCGEIQPFENNTENGTSVSEEFAITERCCEDAEDEEEIALFCISQKRRNGGRKSITMANQANNMLMN